MTSDTDHSGGDDGQSTVEVRILEARAVDEMVGKIKVMAAAPGAGEAVRRWLNDHSVAPWVDRGHDHAVVDETLMYLHDAPDGMVIPHVRHFDGREQVFTDLAHADEAYPRD